MRNNDIHKLHAHERLSTDHIKNVPYLLTHDLIRCEDGFYGWVTKGVADG